MYCDRARTHEKRKGETTLNLPFDRLCIPEEEWDEVEEVEEVEVEVRWRR